MSLDYYYACGYNRFRTDEAKNHCLIDWIRIREKQVQESYKRFLGRKDLNSSMRKKIKRWYEGYFDGMKDNKKEWDEYLTR